MLINEITSPQTINLADLSTLLKGKQTRNQIADIVSSVVEDSVGEEVEISIDTNSAIPAGDMTINAFYDPENDEDGDVAVEIVLVFNPDDKTIEWDNTGAAHFANELSDALKHEFLHANQYRNRDFHKGTKGYDRTSKEYEYMSRPDEIEAYAMNIADELIRKVEKDGALALLRMAKKTAQFKDNMQRLLSPNLFAYFSLFKWDMNNRVLKRLLKKTYQYIMNADV